MKKTTTKLSKVKQSRKNEDRRFYVIVPKKVNIPSRNKKHLDKVVHMVPGRLIAQGFHIGRKLQAKAVDSLSYTATTAIVLGVRNSKELERIANALYKLPVMSSPLANVFADEFIDENPGLYGKNISCMTAVAIGPVTKAEVESAIGHLELYGEFNL